MKKILPLILFLSATCLSATAQSVYELSFSYPSNNNLIAYKAFFIDYNNGKGQARLRFNTPNSPDSVLVDFNVTEDVSEMPPLCNSNERMYYKLQNPKFITSTGPGISFPAYICFKKDVLSGLYEPMGVAASATDCKTDVQKFSMISVIDKKDLTKELVLTYFKPTDFFYRNIFVTNNSKALTTAERDVTLHLLFVANVTDTAIGIANSKDMYDAIKFFRKVKDFLGISGFVYDTVTRNNFNKKIVEQKIDALRPREKDIVVFYFAGHGYRRAKDGYNGPYIDLRDLVVDRQKSYLENSLSTEDIVQRIKKKGACLNLIISDCCNDTVTKTNPIAMEPAVANKKGMFDQFWNTQKCRELFLNANPTTIMAAAARPGHLAISNKEFGGYFSNHFISTLETNLSLASANPKLTWDDIFTQVRQLTETKAGRTWCADGKKCNRQQPIWNIMYGRF
jgi:hypothetical protein